MKKYLFAIFALTIALGVFAQVLPTLASGVYLPVQGGTGTSSTPQSGEFLIGNGNGTYTAAYIVCTGNCTTATSSGGFTINVTGGASSTSLYAGPYIMLTASGTNGYVVSNIGVLSLSSSSDIGVSNATGTGISFSFLNPKGFTTTTIQSVLNSLSAIGLATYNSSTGQFSVSSSSLNLGTASHYSSSDFLPSSTVYVSTVNGQSGAITITSSSLGVLIGVQTTTPYSAGYIPVASTSLALSNSIISQSGTLIGINTSTPFAPLDVVNPSGSQLARLTDSSGHSVCFGTQGANEFAFLGGSTCNSARPILAQGLFLGNTYDETPGIGHIDTASGTNLTENARGSGAILFQIASTTYMELTNGGQLQLPNVTSSILATDGNGNVGATSSYVQSFNGATGTAAYNVTCASGCTSATTTTGAAITVTGGGGGGGGIASSSPFSSPFISLITASGTLTNSTISESTSTGNIIASGTVTAIYTKDGLTYTSFRIFPTAAIGLTNFYTGSLGCEFTVSQELTVTALGRFYNGSSTNNHTEYIWNESNNGLAVTSGTILAASASDSNGNKFVNLTSTVILYPSQTYDMSIDETNGGDYWINNGSQSWNNVDYFQPVINRTAATYASTASGTVATVPGQTCYDAPMFKYTLEANPQLNAQYNASNTGGITMTPEGNLTIGARTADESVGIVSPLAVGRGTGQAGYSLTVAGNSLFQGAQPLMVGDAGSTYGVPGNYVIFSTAGSAQSYDTIEYSAAGLFLSGNPNLYLNWTDYANNPTVTSYGSFTITNENASNPTLTLNPDGGEPLLYGAGTMFTPQIRSDGSIVAGDQNASADAPLEVYSSRQGAPSLTSSSTDLFAIRSTISTALAFGNNNSAPYSVWIQTKRTANDGSAWPLNINPAGGVVSVNLNNVSENAQFSVGGTVLSGSSGHPGCTEYYDSVTSTQMDYTYPSIALGYVVATTTKPAQCQG